MKNYLTGANGVAEAIKKKRGTLYISKQSKRITELMAMANHHGVPCRKVSERDITGMVPSGMHRGYVLEVDARTERKQISKLDDLWPSVGDFSLVIVLDGITDPRNLGAVIRSSDMFSVDAVVIPKWRAAGGDADILSRVSAGAIEWVPLIEVVNLNRSLKELKENGYWIWGADMNGKPVQQVDLKCRTVFVMGSEGKGIHRLVREGCDSLIRIPTTGHIDSLNVASAASILMYETRYQQGFNLGEPLKNH